MASKILPLTATSRVAAIGWILLYLLLITAPMIVLMAGPMPPGQGLVRDLSIGLGFAGISLLGMQLLLTARFRRASAPFGLDILYYFHRLVALIAFAFLLAHYLILRLNFPEEFTVLNPLAAPFRQTMGRLSLFLFAVLIVTSLWRKQLRLDYDWWRVAHATIATIAFLAAVLHIETAGSITEQPLVRVLWFGYALFWVLVIGYVRLAKPLAMLRRPWRVTEVRPERCETWTLRLVPEGHAGLRFAPGQFAWLTLRASPFSMKEHPFSFASSAEDRSGVEFTIKSLGDFTSTIRTIQPGEIAYIEGPYGVFSVDRHPKAPGFVFIAGGVGIVPVMSMLRTLADRGDKRTLLLIYANKCWDDAIQREELEALGGRLDLRVVHVMSRPEPEWEGETGYVTQELLDRHLPDGRQAFEYFLCGPKPMMDALQPCLLGLGVPLGHIHYDRFELV